VNTINNAIPFVPENTTDPAAGLNLSLNQIDALLQTRVHSVGANAPPVGVEGQRHIVGTAPTGAWAGHANKLARYLDAGWQFYDARMVMDINGLIYLRPGTTWTTGKGLSTNDYTTAEQTKLSGIATGATANATDAQLRDRATHTGTQSTATIAGLDTALAGKQPLADNLTSLAGLTGSADRLPYFTGAGALSLATLTAFGRSLAGSADAAAGRSALGLGSAATRTALGSAGSLYGRDSILGVVSQSAGVPTGAIIERGSNANGEFIRYADGTQICLIRTRLTGTSTGRYDVTYPIAFSSSTSDLRVAFGSEDQGSSFTRFYNTSSVVTTSDVILSAYLGVASISFPIRYTVIGRWY